MSEVWARDKTRQNTTVLSCLLVNDNFVFGRKSSWHSVLR
jgi:hypothetical protein